MNTWGGIKLWVDEQCLGETKRLLIDTTAEIIYPAGKIKCYHSCNPWNNPRSWALKGYMARNCAWRVLGLWMSWPISHDKYSITHNILVYHSILSTVDNNNNINHMIKVKTKELHFLLCYIMQMLHSPWNWLSIYVHQTVKDTFRIKITFLNIKEKNQHNAE